MESQNESPPPQNIAFTAVAFEGGLAIVALVLGLLCGHSPLASVDFSRAAITQNLQAIAWGVAAAIPMMAGLLLLDRFPLGAMDRLKSVVDEQIVPLFAATSWSELAVISAAAGIGEEMLFRGFGQTLLAEFFPAPEGAWIGLAIAAVLFGACHWVTTSYAVLATLVGVYFGWLLIATDNLLAPVVAHGLYDFFALVYLVKWKKRGLDDNPIES